MLSAAHRPDIKRFDLSSTVLRNNPCPDISAIRAEESVAASAPAKVGSATVVGKLAKVPCMNEDLSCVGLVQGSGFIDVRFIHHMPSSRRELLSQPL